MKRVLLVGTLLAPVVIIACSGRAPESAPAEAPRAVNAPPLEDYHNGLSDGERQEFYHLSEGGEILPLALLRALKRARTPQDQAGDGGVGAADGEKDGGMIQATQPLAPRRRPGWSVV